MLASAFVFLVLIAHVQCQSLRFLAVGDWGGSFVILLRQKERGMRLILLQLNLKYVVFIVAEIKVAHQMDVVSADNQAKFILGIGDNFYGRGIPSNETDLRFQKTFEEVYAAPSLQVPWYFVLGNHDHRGNVTAQLEYSKLSSRWNLPALFYSEVFPIPETSSTIKLVFLDTSEFSKGNRSEIMIWLENELKNSSSDWLFVVGHYPIYSVAEHGSTSLLKSKLLPLLQQYKVDAYFCGHDHSLQHLESNSMDFFVTGAGHGIKYSITHQSTVSNQLLSLMKLAAGVHGGFLSVVVEPQSFTAQYFDEEGNVLYTTGRVNPRVEETTRTQL